MCVCVWVWVLFQLLANSLRSSYSVILTLAGTTCAGYAQIANEVVRQAKEAAQDRLDILANDLSNVLRETHLEDWIVEQGGWVSSQLSTVVSWCDLNLQVMGTCLNCMILV